MGGGIGASRITTRCAAQEGSGVHTQMSAFHSNAIKTNFRADF